MRGLETLLLHGNALPCAFAVHTTTDRTFHIGTGPPVFHVYVRTSAGQKALESLSELAICEAYMRGDLGHPFTIGRGLEYDPLPGGSLCHHVEWGVSRFIPSARLTQLGPRRTVGGLGRVIESRPGGDISRSYGMRLIRRAVSRFGSPSTMDFGPATAGSLPAWFERNRVQGHTLLHIRPWLDKPEFAQAAVGFKALGAGAFARHVKSGDEDPWWPTAVPLAADGRPLSDRDRYIDTKFIPRGRNIVQEIIDEAHGEGLKIVTYHWHMAEKTFEDLNPDWLCRDEGGIPIEGPRGIHLDITGPYREVVLTRLLELAEMGAGGFFFDYRHLPPRGCWGSALEEAWKAETGEAAAPPRNDADPLYRQFLDFKAKKIEETFVYWHDEVKAAHPDVVFLVSTTTVPALTDREMTTRLAHIADSAKNEYRHALRPDFSKNIFLEYPALAPEDHVRQAVGWTVLRDAADGRAPHIWAPGMPDINHAKAFAASLMTFGCIANMDVDARCLLGNAAPQPGKTPVEGLEAAFALGAAASPHLAGTRPVRWAAVHFAERNRNARADDYRAAWEQVLWPLVGAFQVLSEDGLPVGIVNDDQLERGELDGYHLLVLPNADELTRAQEWAVAAFKALGGVVIENNPAWPWSDPGRRHEAAAAFRFAIGRSGLATAPLRVTGGPAGRYAVSYLDRKAGRLVVAVTNDFSWVQITDLANVPPAINPPAPPVEGVSVTWRTGHGLPEFPRLWPFFYRLRVIEAIKGTPLNVERFPGGYRVNVPKFSFMALVVVTRGLLRPSPFPTRR